MNHQTHKKEHKGLVQLDCEYCQNDLVVSVPRFIKTFVKGYANRKALRANMGDGTRAVIREERKKLYEP